MATAKEQSRKEWTCDKDIDVLNLGCLQRIADATEAMAKRHIELIEENDRLKHVSEYRLHRIHRMYRSNAGLRGYITRLKKKVSKKA